MTLRVETPSVVAVTVADTVQLDRLRPGDGAVVAERHGPLLEPGTRDVALAPGVYAFRTLCDAELAVVSGGVTIPDIHAHEKDDHPDFQASILRGETPRGQTPRLTVRYPSEGQGHGMFVTPVTPAIDASSSQ
ncbi:MAG: hypothetical protein JNK45_23775 [Myxococcales bacterium]|nr:hypothetical protein [Myxococcales bacterium]